MGRLSAWTWSTSLKSFAVVAAIVAPFFLMFNPYAFFGGDMENLFWMTSYEAASIWGTGTDTLVFHIQGKAGIPYPLFYAWGYLVWCGVLVTMIGASITFRLMMLAALTAQFVHTLRLGLRLHLGWWTSYVLSCVLAWSIYSLTNLYTRTAPMEFFSVALLTASLCCLLTIILEGPTPANRYEQVAWGFYFMLVSLSHAITMVYGGLMLALCGLLGLIFQSARAGLLRNMVMTSLAWTVTVLPWLYLMVLFFGRVTISRWSSMAGYYSWTYIDGNSWNNVRNRLWPFARAVWPSDVKQTGFDTQIAAALLIVLAGYMVARLFFAPRLERRGNGWLLYSLTALGLVAAVVCYLAASVVEINSWSVRLFFLMQFPYRAVSYVNFGLFIAVVALLARTEFKDQLHRRLMGFTLGLALLFAAAGLVTKLNDAPLVRYMEDHEDYSWLTMHHVNVSLGLDTVNVGDYDVLDIPKLDDDGDTPVPARFQPSKAPHLAEVDPLEIDLPRESLVGTDVMCFPWNKIYVDGAHMPSDPVGYTTKVVPDVPTYAFRLGPGHHRLTYAFVPDRFYVFLRYVSLVAFLAWSAVFLGTLLRPLLLKR
jgi:hypothetical protein